MFLGTEQKNIIRLQNFILKRSDKMLELEENSRLLESMYIKIKEMGELL